MLKIWESNASAYKLQQKLSNIMVELKLLLYRYYDDAKFLHKYAQDKSIYKERIFSYKVSYAYL